MRATLFAALIFFTGFANEAETAGLGAPAGSGVFAAPNIFAFSEILGVPIPVFNGSVAIALPPGADMEIRNDGAAMAFCRLGATAAVEASAAADEELAPGVLRRLKVGANTHIACVTRDGATVVTLFGRAPDGEKN
jgi:hypothetical protein